MIASGPTMSILAPNPIIAQRIEARLEILLRTLQANWLEKITQSAPAKFWFVAKLRHEIAAMPFHPANFIRGKIAFPARQRFSTHLRKSSLGRGISFPKFAVLCRCENNGRIIHDLEKRRDSYHPFGGFEHELFVRNNQ